MKDREGLQEQIRRTKSDISYAERTVEEKTSALYRAERNLEYADIAEDLVFAVLDVRRGVRSFAEVESFAQSVARNLGILG